MTTVNELIDEAKQIYENCGEDLSGDKAISKHLSEYRNRISATNRLMQLSDIVNTCSSCAEKKPGSCCMQDVEEWYDPVLLLINLLMGVELPDYREIPGHCLFVGRNGCKLIARYSFCVNYICPELKKLLGPVQTQNIMTVAGQELLSGWETEKSVHNWLNLHYRSHPLRQSTESPHNE